MSSDLIFSVLPRQGTTPVQSEEQKVVEVSKDASLRTLSDEEQELKAEERDARQQQNKEQQKRKKQPRGEQDESGITLDDEGHAHLDIYV